MDGRLFGLDVQLVFDALVMFVFIMLLFVIMSNLFFKPVRAFLEKRQEGIDKDYEEAKAQEAKAQELKAAYEEKLKIVNKEAENLMSVSRRQALKEHEAIVAAAKEEAADILWQAQTQAYEDKRRVKGDVKQQMAEIAGLMAMEFVPSQDPFATAMLVEESIKEMGGEAWQN